MRAPVAAETRSSYAKVTARSLDEHRSGRRTVAMKLVDYTVGLVIVLFQLITVAFEDATA